ncbi:MAG: sugar transferase [Eubacteriales bacterium]|nr:sugar transferase [Eubacteriales bacterium]
MYSGFIKRTLDLILSLTAIIVLLPLLLILTALGAVAMSGNPFFIQMRPGRTDKKTGNERIFRLIKFRTMSNRKDQYGSLLSDEERLNGYGKFLRSTSLDELPSLINILIGDMSIVWPRPQLVRDMIFMTDEQRRRHTVRPGLTGLAQVNGRNNITWEQKFDYDLQYIDRGITFIGDLKIILKTLIKVVKRSDVVREGTVSDMDYGDWLMLEGKIDKATYDENMAKAKELV